MLVILSPAKDMKILPSQSFSELSVSSPMLLKRTEKLVKELIKLNPSELSQLMKISDKLATLNFNRFQNWQKELQINKGTPAILAFTGEVYRGLRAKEMDTAELNYSQNVLRILSGLYGILSPLDLIQEYRLEMGTKLRVAGKTNLYDYWRSVLTKTIDEAIANSPGDKVLVNLASNEYSSSIEFKKLKHKIVSPVFKQETNGNLQIIAVYAKKARGMMTRFIIENKIEKIDDIKAFDVDGYYFDNTNSTIDNWLFVR